MPTRIFPTLPLKLKLGGMQEIIGDTSLGRYSTNPRIKIQCVENVNMALEFIKQRGVPLTNIGAEGELQWGIYMY